MRDLSIITVTHESAEFIEDQVFSVLSGAMTISFEQIVVDNASRDGTGKILEGMEFLKVVLNGENRGFAKANNQALDLAEGRYLLFLNPDMKVREGSLDRMVEWMDAHPEVGIGSCTLVDAQGNVLEKGRDLPKVWTQVLWLLGVNVEDKGNEMAKGAFMMVRRELVDKLGFAFDPRYFLLFEDADLCREAKRLGYRVDFHPEVRCVDLNSRSFAMKEGRWIYDCLTESMLAYFRKWEPWYKWIWIALFRNYGRR